MPDPEITVVDTFSELIWKPVYSFEIFGSTTKAELPKGTLLTRATAFPTELGYHYTTYSQQTATPAWPVGQVGAILAENLAIDANTKKTVRVLVQGWVRKNLVQFRGAAGDEDRTANVYDIDYFQRYGIYILDTDVNFIEDNE